MSKYGDFKVVRTERRVPKQSGDRNVDDADGMREYSFLKCPHCHLEDIIITSLNVERNKHPVIREHIVTCPAYTGERPVKRCKAVKLVPSEATVSKEMFQTLEQKIKEQNIKEQDLLRTLVATQQENEMFKVHIKTLHVSMEELEMECDEYEQDVAESWRDATARIRSLRAFYAPFLQHLMPR